MRKIAPVVLLVFACFTVCLLYSFTPKKINSTSKEVAKKTKKIVFIPGQNSHGIGEHEHLGGCQLLAKLLNENVSGVNAIVTEQGWPKDTTILNDADVIVMYADGGERNMTLPHLAHMTTLMNKGIGLVNLHYAVEVPAGTAGDDFLNWVGGYFEIHWSVNPFWMADFTSFPKHEITSGVKPFQARDEWYYHMRFRENMDHITPILSLLPPNSTLERKDGTHEGNPYVRKAVADGEAQILSWTYERPNGGRGFSFTGGHMHNNWAVDGYRKLVLNGIVWAAKMKVPESGIETPTPTQAELDSYLKKL